MGARQLALPQPAPRHVLCSDDQRIAAQPKSAQLLDADGKAARGIRHSQG
jgi:hypothetical protein